MSLTTTPDRSLSDGRSGRRRIVHAYCRICCSPIAACGFRRQTPPDFTKPCPPDADRCVVCEDLLRSPCACGAGASST